VLAEVVRLDHAQHRPVAGDSAQVEAMKLVARTHQTLIWDRSRQLLGLGSVLREFFPAALHALDDLTAPDALELLSRAPDPDRAARLSRSQIAAALRRANRRDVQAKATRVQELLRAAQLRQPTVVQAAYAAVVTTQVRLIAALNAEVDQVGQVVAGHFGRHRDAERYLSQPASVWSSAPGSSPEFGDDPHRFTNAKARRNYAGTSPITRAFGTRKVVLARYARNRRLGHAVHQWAFCAMRGAPGARAYYQAMRARGIGHQAALRQLGNRLVGILHGCLKTNTSYDEATAWTHLQASS
jgi:Transposase/Transposase IS116/IS110/IS902 family